MQSMLSQTLSLHSDGEFYPDIYKESKKYKSGVTPVQLSGLRLVKGTINTQKEAGHSFSKKSLP